MIINHRVCNLKIYFIRHINVLKMSKRKYKYTSYILIYTLRLTITYCYSLTSSLKYINFI
jgi:hypothetical protein